MRSLKLSQIPKKLYVKDEIYKVKLVKRIPGHDKDTVGLCDPGTNTIWISTDQSNRHILRTLIHEATHAVEFVYDLKIKHKLVYKLEKAIYNLLMDNF
jgi:hypothetical protein